VLDNVCGEDAFDEMQDEPWRHGRGEGDGLVGGLTLPCLDLWRPGLSVRAGEGAVELVVQPGPTFGQALHRLAHEARGT